MFKKDWNKEFKKMTASKGVDPFKVEPTPYRDWRFLVIGFFVILTSSIGFNIYMSIEINRDSFFTTTPKVEEGTHFNSEGLAIVLGDLASKEVAFEKLRIEGVPVVDPSL
ncbi:MAG: hypothetical protein A2481_03690 [Candidatus Yonathbacteria bacterium RIFOXYC2_FULL_47_9]|nr:MAG: hypothetical protein A2481_03690 [Candidatus Yonathbacteria bacterium RIFOXYC2_FULL_47_9]HAT68791.1 hypothetical protein [Candidatus Yonathbacteria bacterium]